MAEERFRSILLRNVVVLQLGLHVSLKCIRKLENYSLLRWSAFQLIDCTPRNGNGQKYLYVFYFLNIDGGLEVWGNSWGVSPRIIIQF